MRTYIKTHQHSCRGCDEGFTCNTDEQHCEWDGYCDECADRLDDGPDYVGQECCDDCAARLDDRY